MFLLGQYQFNIIYFDNVSKEEYIYIILRIFKTLFIKETLVLEYLYTYLSV